ncbi:MAG: prephenate dehydrogenase [Candidatus Izemoplasmataceae bacterium]
MKIFIVGLGLIGASYAAKLSEKHEVHGFDINQLTLQKALDKKIIVSASLEAITKSEVVILALYPKDIIQFLKDHLALFNDRQIITDVSGTKQNLIDAIATILPKTFTYISHHPMAGKELGGFDQHDKDLFKNASAIIIDESHHEEAIKKLTVVLNDLAFKTIVKTTKTVHDARIAFTSQLPHALAIALMHMTPSDDILSYAGNSFKDLTRIASINKMLWSSLFMENKTALTHELDHMIEHLNYIKNLINTNNQDGLKAYMQKAKERRDRYEKDSN